MIPFPCPACRKDLAVKEELASKKARCPHCGQSLTAMPVDLASPWP